MSAQAIDWDLCLKMSNGDEESAKEMLNLFMQTIPKDYAEIQELFNAKKYDDLGNVVHRFHGGLCYTGLPPLRQATKDLECIIRAKNYGEIEGAFSTFSEEINQALAAWERGDYC